MIDPETFVMMEVGCKCGDDHLHKADCPVPNIVDYIERFRHEKRDKLKTLRYLAVGLFFIGLANIIIWMFGGG